MMSKETPANSTASGAAQYTGITEFVEITQKTPKITNNNNKRQSKCTRKSGDNSISSGSDTTKCSYTTRSSSVITISSDEQNGKIEAKLDEYAWEDEYSEVSIKKTLKEVSETDSESLSDGCGSTDLESGSSSLTTEKNTNRRDSELPAHEDPFAPRPGRTLSWRDVNMKLSGTRREPERKILQDVWGEIPRKKVTAIMGPSGAGKTSLLNILSGRASSRGRLKINGDIRLDGFSVNPQNMKVRKLIAFVAQDDSLQMTATPREAIAFSARLRLPRSTSKEDIQRLTNRMLSELGLDECADTIIGGALVKGLSGGERKRTSVGVELCCKPDLLFLDEPTSGLDSFSAVQLCQVLKKVANAGASVLCTIHQPSSDLFNSFDGVILMNAGRVMYQGPARNVPRYFERRGHPCPQHYNPADWIMNCAKAIPICELERDGFFPVDKRAVEPKIKMNAAAKKLLFDCEADAVMDPRPASTLTQIGQLLRRELVNVVRDKLALAGRFGISTSLSLLIGAIFLDIGKSDKSSVSNLQSHFGALVLCFFLGMCATAQPALLAFPAERPVFVREYSTNHYSVHAYFISRLIVEAIVTGLQVATICAITYPMLGFSMSMYTYAAIMYALAMSSTALAVALGCAVEDTTIGMELFPLLFVPQMLFSGFFVTPALIPVWLRWGRFICPLTFGLLVASLEEFQECGEGWMATTNCSLLIKNMEADPDDVPLYWILMVALFVGFRLLALSLLHKKASKFF